MDSVNEDAVRSRFNLDDAQKKLEDFHFKETRSDIQSSVILLGHRVKRQYMSEFVLPDDTRIAVRRTESSMPADQTQVVVVSLAVGHPFDSLLPKFVEDLQNKAEYDSTTTLNTSEDVLTETDDDDEEYEKLDKVCSINISFDLKLKLPTCL